MNIYSQVQTNIIPQEQKTNYIVGNDLLANLHQIPAIKEKNYSGFLVLSDRIVFNLYGEKIISSLQELGKPIAISIIPEGEQSKNVALLPKIVKPFFKNGFNRNACLVSLGGGVITDLGGFFASILLRGISLINIPTTLLGQVDAAIGGKNGVDFWLTKNLMAKNMLGTFRQPDLVITDIDTLQTLPNKEILNGLWEMVKYWVGWGRPNLRHLGCGPDSVGRLLRGGGNSKAIKTPPRWPSSAGTPRMVEESEIANIVSICQKIKIDIVQQDPFDVLGIREKLNLGHTIGHAIEGASEGRLSHGEAISLGLTAAAKISLLKGLLSKSTYQLILKTFQKFGLPVKMEKLNKRKVLAALKLDKKGDSFVLIKDIGKLKTGILVEAEIIDKVLSEIIRH